MGNVLLQLNRPQEAIEPLQHAVQLLPNSPKAYSNLATAYAQMHRFPEAIEAAQQALKLARSTGRADLVEPIEIALKSYRAGQTMPDGKAAASPGGGVGP